MSPDLGRLAQIRQVISEMFVRGQVSNLGPGLLRAAKHIPLPRLQQTARAVDDLLHAGEG
jgi:hypothetical protein